MDVLNCIPAFSTVVESRLWHTATDDSFCKLNTEMRHETTKGMCGKCPVIAFQRAETILASEMRSSTSQAGSSLRPDLCRDRLGQA